MEKEAVSNHDPDPFCTVVRREEVRGVTAPARRILPNLRSCRHLLWRGRVPRDIVPPNVFWNYPLDGNKKDERGSDKIDSEQIDVILSGLAGRVATCRTTR